MMRSARNGAANRNGIIRWPKVEVPALSANVLTIHALRAAIEKAGVGFVDENAGGAGAGSKKGPEIKPATLSFGVSNPREIRE